MDPAEVASQLADQLEAACIPYALGGALAYAYSGVARGTHDVDSVGEEDERVQKWDVLCVAVCSFSSDAVRQGRLGEPPVRVGFGNPVRP